jgi:hypothetical protein
MVSGKGEARRRKGRSRGHGKKITTSPQDLVLRFRLGFISSMGEYYNILIIKNNSHVKLTTLKKLAMDLYGISIYQK